MPLQQIKRGFTGFSLEMNDSRISLPLEILRNSGWTFVLPVHGRSMEPLLHDGDSVTVVSCPATALKPGLIVCFRRGDDSVLHRLIEQRADGFWLEKGDAEIGGTWIAEDTIWGRVTHCNEQPLSAATARRVLRGSRAEWHVAHVFHRLGFRRIVARFAGVWRRLKTSWLNAWLSGE